MASRYDVVRELRNEFMRQFPQAGPNMIQKMVDSAIKVDHPEWSREAAARRVTDNATSFAAELLGQSQYWRTADKRKLRIQQVTGEQCMDTTHIENTMAWLVQQSFRKYNNFRHALDAMFPDFAGNSYSTLVRRTAVYQALRQERIRRFARELDESVKSPTEKFGDAVEKNYVSTAQGALREPTTMKVWRTEPGYPHR